MAVPRTRTSNSRKNNRRAYHAKKPKNFSKCPNCGGARVPHALCIQCGHYKGKAVIHGKAAD